MSGPLLGNMSPEILSAEQSCSTSARQQPTISEGDKALMLMLQPNRCVCVCGGGVCRISGVYLRLKLNIQNKDAKKISTLRRNYLLNISNRKRGEKDGRLGDV